MLGIFPSVMLVVHDLGESLHFYCDHLGMSLFEQDEWDGHRVAYLALDDFKLVLIQQPANEQAAGKLFPGLAKGDGVLLSFCVSSVSRLSAAFQKDGTPILRDLKDAPWGEKTLMVADPDGYAVLLAEQTALQA